MKAGADEEFVPKGGPQRNIGDDEDGGGDHQAFNRARLRAVTQPIVHRQQKEQRPSHVVCIDQGQSEQAN